MLHPEPWTLNPQPEIQNTARSAPLPAPPPPPPPLCGGILPPPQRSARRQRCR